MAHSTSNSTDYEVFYDLERPVINARPTESLEKRPLADRIRGARDEYLANPDDPALKLAYIEAIKSGDQARLGFYSVEEEADKIRV